MTDMRQKRILLIALTCMIPIFTACSSLEKRGDRTKNQPISISLLHKTYKHKIPVPASWSFPEVIKHARTIAPKNTEGRTFKRSGMAYSLDEVKNLHVFTMSAEELQKYADIVTHAYPDAAYIRTRVYCDDISISNLNETGVANLAYVSINAILPSVRDSAGKCLKTLQLKYGGK